MISEALPTEYKRFPSHWKILFFSEAFEDKTGGQTKIQKGDYLNDGLLPIVDQGQSLFGGFTNDPDSVCKIELPCILFGDHTKTFKFIEKPFALGADGVKVLKQRNDIEPKFAFHYLNTLTLPDVGYSRHFRFLKRTFFPIPPLAEQRRIAAILDKADAVRRKRQEAIALTEELLRSAFLEMFGDPATNPKGWEVKPLAKVVQPDTIVTYGIVQAGPHVENGIPYVRTGDIKNGQIIEPGLLRTSPDIAKKYKRSEVYAGDIVISIRATVGTTARVPASLNGANLTQGTAKISPGPDTDGNYLFWFTRSNGCQDWIQRQVKGATFREITLERLRLMPVMLPPLALQSEFGKIVNQTIQCTRKLELAKGKEENLFNSLLQRAFRGEL